MYQRGERYASSGKIECRIYIIPLCLSYVLNVNCMCLNWLKFILFNYFYTIGLRGRFTPPR